ncbi:MAG: polyprenyl synthetase family protein [Gammaproteobacteria bacterium]|nr:polyprenyl synthetase family protein [Gammaproteobacteria bacterium]
MDVAERIEQVLSTALDTAGARDCPPRLAEATRYAVFPGGARVRPQLCMAVALACSRRPADISCADGAAAALELLHCASLVHDDMPCFDNAATRRGKPSVHRAYGENLALLVGDALIVLAFQTLARLAAAVPQRIGSLVGVVGASTGMPSGIVAGQAFECEPSVGLKQYHQAKTGALFAGCTATGAIAAGADPDLWRPLGDALGEAYQVADDIRDAVGDAEQLGKPVGVDSALGRPSAVVEFGIEGAAARLRHLIARALDSVPQCPGEADLKITIRAQSRRFLPPDLARRFAA